MNAPSIPPRFPKIHSPFERHENDDGEYVVYDAVNEELDWYVNGTAVEKLDGTNCAVWIPESRAGTVGDAFTRMGDKSMNWVHPYSTNTNDFRVVRGVQNAANKGYFQDLGHGYHFGELVGPKIQGNPYELDEHLFVPFEWAREHLEYKAWGDYGTDYDAVSYWFEEELFSLFYAHIHGVGLDEASVANGTFCEGVMFTREKEIPNGYTAEGQSYPQSEHYAKLRRDMFDWYEGDRH